MRHDSRVFKIGSGIFIKPTIWYATPGPLDLSCASCICREQDLRNYKNMMNGILK
jgi:hypothetical protein